jgi:hypothetical protein
VERRRGQRSEGWWIVAWAAAAIAAMVAAVLVAAGAGEVGLRAGIRATARSSVLLFLAAFSASALATTWPGAATKWLLRNRRYIGVSFAVSQLAHGALIVALVVAHTESFLATTAMSSIVGGLIGYGLIALMTATSFDRTAAWVGRRAWRALHTTGMYYLWLVFATTYLGLAGRSPAMAMIAAAIVGTLALRAVAAVSRRRRRARA